MKVMTFLQEKTTTRWQCLFTQTRKEKKISYNVHPINSQILKQNKTHIKQQKHKNKESMEQMPKDFGSKWTYGACIHWNVDEMLTIHIVWYAQSMIAQNNIVDLP
jgi:hypothetical protein